MKQISVVGTSGSLSVVHPQFVEVGLDNLHQLGFKVVFAFNVFANRTGLAGTLSERIISLEELLASQEENIILSAIGGYNTNEILDQLSIHRTKTNSTKFVGGSDFCAFLLAGYSKGSQTMCHGPSFVDFCNPTLSDITKKSFVRSMSDDSGFELMDPCETRADDWYKNRLGRSSTVDRTTKWKFFREGEARGPLVSTNLDTALALAGTRWLPNLAGHILFIEERQDIEPTLFRRQVEQLSQLVGIDQILALGIGAFPPWSRMAKTENLSFALQSISERSQFPIITGLNMSHVEPKLTLRLGSDISITSTCEAKPTIKVVKMG